LGLTQAQVAAVAGVTLKTLPDFERGKTNIRIETLIRLLAAANLTIDLVDMPTLQKQDDTPW